MAADAFLLQEILLYHHLQNNDVHLRLLLGCYICSVTVESKVLSKGSSCGASSHPLLIAQEQKQIKILGESDEAAKIE
jgi:hypothetical protein